MWPRINYYYVIGTISLICMALTLQRLNTTCNREIKKPLSFNESVLEAARLMIKLEAWNYNFSESGVEGLSELVIEDGGTPVRSLLVSSWRSGSSFLGDLLNAVPGSFYNYEPFMIYGPHRIRGPPHSIDVTRTIKNMLQCNFNHSFNGTREYFTYVEKIKKKVNQIELNRRLFSLCKLNEDLLCYDAEFVSRICKLFPFQVMKTVRLRLAVVEPILEDEELNLKIVLLVRDPRPVLRSRRHFCITHDCADPRYICEDMVDDHLAAGRLLAKYPDRVKVLRYEDLIYDLEGTVQELLRFLRLERSASVLKFLKTHTNISDSKPFSTFRVSQTIPYKWRTTMNFSWVNEIQEACKEAMSRWGYEVAHNASHLMDAYFNPVQPYQILPTMDQTQY